MTNQEFSPETQAVELTWSENLMDRFQDGVNSFAPEAETEAGFVQIWAAKKMGGLVLKPFFATPTRAVASIASGLFVATTLGGAFLHEREINGGANLDNAKTSSQASVLVFNKKQELKIADMYFNEKFTARNIPYEINWRPVPFGPDVIPDYKVNKELNGVGEISYTIPFDAVTPHYDTATQKTDYQIDKAKLKLQSHWVEPPVSVDFVQNGTQRTYQADGFKSNLVNNISESFTHFDVNNFKNAVNDINLLVGRTMAQKALEVSADECSAQLDTHLEEAAREAVIANVESLGQKAVNVGTVSFKDGKWVFTSDEVPAVVQSAVDKSYEHNRNITVKETKVDNVKCYTKDAKVQ